MHSVCGSPCSSSCHVVAYSSFASLARTSFADGSVYAIERDAMTKKSTVPRNRGVPRTPHGDPLAQAPAPEPVAAAPPERGVAARPNPRRPHLVRDVHG